MANKFILAVALVVSSWVNAEEKQANYLDQIYQMDAQIDFLRKRNELNDLLRKGMVVEDLPKVMSIVSDKAGASVQVIYSSGLIRWLHEGDQVQEGIKISKIRNGAVSVVGNGIRQSLAFLTPAATASSIGTAGVGVLPPLPNINVPMPSGAPGTRGQ